MLRAGGSKVPAASFLPPLLHASHSLSLSLSLWVSLSQSAFMAALHDASDEPSAPAPIQVPCFSLSLARAHTHTLLSLALVWK
jgi:hypothetical protein